MSRQNSIIFFLLSILIVSFIYMMSRDAKSEYYSSLSDLKKFEVEAKSLAKLKSKFGKKEDKRVIASLNRISQPSKDFKKSNSRVLVYENLALSTLANMIRRIENSTINIKNIEITRVSDSSANLRLEIEK